MARFILATETGGVEMNFTDVDADRVLSAKAQISNDVSGMARTRDVFRNQIVSALEPCWRGQAKDTFTTQWGAFTAAFENFVKETETLNNELERIAKGYNDADGEARRLVNSLPK